MFSFTAIVLLYLSCIFADRKHTQLLEFMFSNHVSADDGRVWDEGTRSSLIAALKKVVQLQIKACGDKVNYAVSGSTDRQLNSCLTERSHHHFTHSLDVPHA